MSNAEMEALINGPPRLADDMYVVIAERDCDDPFRSRGAIIMEQYTNSCDRDSCIERTQKLKRYGRRWIARLAFIEEITEGDAVTNIDDTKDASRASVV